MNELNFQTSSGALHGGAVEVAQTRPDNLAEGPAAAVTAPRPEHGGGANSSSNEPAASEQSTAKLVPPRFLQVGKLTVHESARKASCMQLVDEGLEYAIRAGYGLTALNVERLYRDETETFSEFVELHWGMRVRHAYRLMDHFKTMKVINGVTEDGVVSNWTDFTIRAPESQTRPFLGLPLEHRREAWEEAVSTAPGGKMTAKHGTQVVALWRKKLGLAGDIVAGLQNERTPAKPPVDLPVGNKDTQVELAIDQAIAAMRLLCDTLGTLDSAEAAEAFGSLNALQRLKDKRADLKRMHSKRRSL
jgi:hypothetical protein